MKATKSNMGKKFDEHRSRGLRCMADGGLVSNRKAMMENIAGNTAVLPAAPAPAPAPVVTAPVQPAQPMTAEDAEWQRIKAEKLAPKPTLMSNVKKVFGFADGGMFDNVVSGSSSSGRLSNVSGKMVRQDPSLMRIRTPNAVIGVRGADGGEREEIIKQQGLRGALRAAEVHEGPGKVKGPKGKDKVNARLTHGEYVVPEDTVEAVGKEALDDMVLATHEFDDPRAMARYTDSEDHGGVEKFIDGGSMYANGLREYYIDGGQYRQRPPLTSVSPEAAKYVQSQYATGTPAPAPVVSNKPTAPSFRGNPFAGGAAIAALPTALQAYNTPTSEYARRLGVDEPSSFVGDLAVRGAGTLQDFGNMLTGGIADRVGNAVISADDPGGMSFDHSPAYNAPVQPAATSVPQSQPTAAAAAPVRTPATAAPVAAPAQPDTSLRSSRVGNNVTITGNGGPEPVAMQTREGRQAQLRAAYAPTQYAPTDNRSLRERDPAAFDMPARTIGQQFDKDVAAKRGLRTARLQMELDQRERDSIRQYGAAAARDQVTMRGQDMTAKTAREAGARDQENKDRQFKLDVAKYGTDVAEKNRAAASASDEALQKSLESRFRTTDAKGNDVADTAKVGQFRTAVSATMPRMIEQLEATKNPAAIAKAQQLRQRGAAALEPGDWDNLQQYYDTRDRMRASKGLGPNQASMAESDNLLDYRQSGVEHRTFGGNRVVTPAGSISYNDLRYTEPANKILPDFFKTENRNLTRGLRREQ